MPDQIDPLEAETVKQIVVVENQIRKAIELIEIFGFCGASMRRRIHTMVGRQVVEESVPLLAERTVKIDHGRALALDNHRIGREAARQLDALRCLHVHAWTLAAPLVILTAGRASCA